ncbi:S-layer homology domain-containing protein, partial [Pseudoflavonifractor phocaeensis]|uniref:S-layer homology domain-containing protein n=1 Tax=Pseudoflavonifractor phocaeensis TaxID=1870988 RepID=UPI0019565153
MRRGLSLLCALALALSLSACTTQEPQPTGSVSPEPTPAATLSPAPTVSPSAEPTPTPEPEAPAFSDIQGHWAQTYIEEATRLGLISGTGSDTFSPDQAITRQEMMVLIDRCMDLPDENGLGFSDDGQIAFWALEAAARTTAAGLIQGNNGKLMPNASAS